MLGGVCLACIRGARENRRVKRVRHIAQSIAMAGCLCALAACPKRTTGSGADAPPPQRAAEAPREIDACRLLTAEDIQAVQGAAPLEAKSSRSDGTFVSASCVYILPSAADSVSLILTTRGVGGDSRSPREWWEETFRRDDREESQPEDGSQRSREERRGEKEAKPEKIEGIGEQAFWMGTRFGGTLYVLKGDAAFRLNVGGNASDQRNVRREKAKALAAAAAKRL